MSKHDFKQELYAEVGTSEPFMARICIGLTDILNGTSVENREAVNEAILTIALDGLLPALLSLREIRAYESGAKPLVRANLDKEYTNLYSHLWSAYKDRMQSATKALGFDLGFLFQDDAKFEAGAELFVRDHRDIGAAFVQMLRDDRQTWATLVGSVRNHYIEHKKVTTDGVRKYFTLEQVEVVFQNCWTAIEEILVVLLRTRLPLHAGIDIAEIPVSERDPSCPKRFRFVATRPLESIPKTN